MSFCKLRTQIYRNNDLITSLDRMISKAWKCITLGEYLLMFCRWMLKARNFWNYIRKAWEASAELPTLFSIKACILSLVLQPLSTKQPPFGFNKLTAQWSSVDQNELTGQRRLCSCFSFSFSQCGTVQWPGRAKHSCLKLGSVLRVCKGCLLEFKCFEVLSIWTPLVQQKQQQKTQFLDCLQRIRHEAACGSVGVANSWTRTEK